MDAFAGKYKLTESHGFDDYMRAIGKDDAKRMIANKATPIVSIYKSTAEDAQWNLKTDMGFGTTLLTFTIGKAFDETTSEGVKLKSTMSLSAPDTLVQEQRGADDFRATLTRQFCDGEMTLTLECNETKAVRKYHKISEE